MAASLLTAACGTPAVVPILKSTGAAQFQFPTDGSQCDLLTDLRADGQQVPYLQAVFRHDLPDKASTLVVVMIRPYQGTGSYPAVSMPGVPTAASSEPSQLHAGASLRLTRFSATGDRQDWAPTSGKIEVGNAESGQLSGSIDVDMAGEAAAASGAKPAAIHLAGAWKCSYLKDPLSHF